MTTTEPITTHLTGHAAMYKWNPSWKHCDIPRWARKPLRAYVKWLEACNETGVNSDLAMWLQCNYRDIVDHWGSVKDRRGQRVLVMCPYGRHDGVAAELAKIINAKRWTCTPGGPWHPSSFLYTFEEYDMTNSVFNAIARQGAR